MAVVERWLDYEQSLFFLGPSSKTLRHTNDHAWVWLCEQSLFFLFSSRAAALVSRVSRLRRSTLALDYEQPLFFL